MTVPNFKKPTGKPIQSVNESPASNEVRSGAPQHLDRMSLLAHQLITPLSTISTLAQGMMRRADRLKPADIRDRAERIWSASLRLNRLIETILSYTRLNVGALSPQLDLFDLEALIRRVCEEQGQQEPARHFTLDLQNVPTSVLGDPILLEQAFVIVISNAMKYSPVETPIRVIGRRENGRSIIAVRDEGLGIPRRDLPYLMQPFFRGQNVRHMSGTGLGLSLAWHILKLHGGSLEIESEEGNGTTVTFTLLDEQPSHPHSA